MDTRLHVLMALDGLRFGAGREEVIDAMTAVADQAFAAGRVEGRLDMLTGQNEEVG